MDRDTFLNRVATRLGRPRLQAPPVRSVIGAPLDRSRVAPGSAAELAEKFCSELESLGGRTHRADSLAAAHTALRAELEAWEASRVVTWARSEFVGWGLDWLWDEFGARAFGDAGLADDGRLRNTLLYAEAGITTVDFAIASTGTVVVSAAPARPRGVSLLPPTHIALVRADQLVPHLGPALQAYGGRTRDTLPSAIHFITGPSRTSDIENDLTIGVHGPAAVVAIVLGDEL